jgi:hypothetical protein
MQIHLADFVQVETLVEQKASNTSHGSWNERRCDQCYKNIKGKYEKYMQNCEDSTEENFNHTLLRAN